MQTEIEAIYRKVAGGTLSKAEALAMIRQLREAAQSPCAEACRPPNGALEPSPAVPGFRRTLSDLNACASMFQPLATESKVSLSPLIDVASTAPTYSLENRARLKLTDHGAGIFQLSISSGPDREPTSGFLASFGRYLAELAEKQDAKVVLVSGDWTLRDTSKGNLAACLSALRDCELPVLGALAGDVLDLGWVLASCCDLVVCSDSGRFGFSDACALEIARQDWRAFLNERFGAELATNILQQAVPLTGSQLADRGLSIPVVPADVLEARALELAQSLAAFPRQSLCLLKRHLSRSLQESAVRNAAPGFQSIAGSCPVRNPAPTNLPTAVEIPLQSSAVKLLSYSDGVAVATLSDPATKNAFSPALTQGIQELFEHIRANPTYKALVLTGYDRFFASGGTKEGLLSIHHGTARYSDAPLYELPLRCEIPVIAAMQGHAIGAGWSFGLFCEEIILADEGLYSSRFMRYGFTPGFGSTLIFEERFGHDLGREILFTARDYSGLELKERRVRMPVVPSCNVLPLALQRAHELALSPRQLLVEAKRNRAQPLLERLPAIVRAELAMHDNTFVANDEALKRIERNYDAPNPQPNLRPTPTPLPVASHHTLAEIQETLRSSLAAELRMEPAEIEEHAPFTDLGLDSITGVSWVRRINKLFGIAISANEVYQAPTLGEFTQLVWNRLPQTTASAPCADVSVQHQPRPEHAANPPVPRPLSEGQRGLWLLHRIDPGMGAYNVPVAFWIRDTRWAASLQSALNALLQKHPILRGRIATDEQGQPCQYFAPANEIRIQCESIPGLSDDQVLAHLKAAFKKPFRLDNDPLLRVQLFDCGNGRQAVLITIHHILFDGTSLAIFLRDFLSLWSRAARSSAPLAVSAAPPEYLDFVEWEQSFLKTELAQAQLEYWKHQLTGELSHSELPPDKQRPPRRTYVGASISSQLPAELSDRLRALAKERRVSLFTLLLAIYKVLLHRHTREQNLVVGVPVARRPEERFKDAIGYFVNMVAIKSAPSPEITFTGYLEDLKWTVLHALENSQYPFSRLVSELRIEPSLTHSPVFQTVFVLQTFMSDAGLLPPQDSGIDVLHGLHQEGEYDLRVEVVDRGSELEVCAAFDSDLFHPQTIERFVEHFSVLAETVTRDPGQCIGQYAILPEAERHLVERAWNTTHRPYSSECCLHDVFEQRAKERPDAIALVSKERQLTYGEVQDQSDALAACLQSRGVLPEDRVALCMERSPEMVIGILGVLKAGAAYVPLDPTYPCDRIAFLLQDSGAKLLLTDAAHSEQLSKANRAKIKTLVVDRDWEHIQTEAKGRPPAPRAKPSNLAYVIYTSGSTGRPKGVMVEHRQILNTLRYLQERYPVGKNDTYLLKTNYTFDVSLAELFGWFFGCGRLAVLHAGDERFPDRIAEAIRCYGVTHVNFVPSALGVFLGACNHAPEPGKLVSLKYVVVAGEAFPKEMVSSAVRAFPGASVENIYGPTETSIYACGYSCRTPEVESANTPIGRPIANTQLYVLDSQRRSTGIGILGELCIAGKGVARGYLNRPELTAERFIDNPFEPGTHLFLTGDLVRWIPDGDIEYFGRIDQQVKIRGFRVEPGEIESALNQHEAIEASAVVAKGEGASRHLVAYYVQKQGKHGIQPETLTGHLSSLLPEYMVPAFFVTLATIPHTPSGKIDRRALASNEIGQVSRGPVIPPRHGIESRVAEIWKQVLNLESISVTDRFFELGGNSLLAVTLADRISREFGRAFPASALFKHSSIQAISQELAPPEELHSPQAHEGKKRSERPRCIAPEATLSCDDSLAIIGMSCCFPGAADLNQFWSLLREGRSGAKFLSKEQLRERGVPEPLSDDPKYVPIQLAIEDSDCFDADFFNIPARNAFLMDPQFRQLLMHSWRAVEDAGYVANRIPETSVFISAGSNFYQGLLEKAGLVEPADAYTAWVLAQGGTIPAMIAYALGFTGPSLFVHSNCSSSLAGLNLACQSLRSGESKYALVGGATVFYPSRDGYLHRPGLNFSSDGRCKAFDASADGMVGGEGVAVILLKRAKEALADGDPIYALIRGVAMNNDGPERAGFYSPGARGQAAVIDTVIRTTGIDPETIGYVEAHGTGTHLGDPVEVMALTDAYRRHTTRTGFCGLGSVKSNIGHADTAAGLAGCIKVALCLYHRTLVPSINYQAPNPAIDFSASPFYVANKLVPWTEKASPRRAALSSFGIGGSNVHAILEEASTSIAERTAPEEAGPLLIPISAKNPERLEETIVRLLRFLETQVNVNFHDLAYTLAVGREQMDSRAIFLARDRADLLLKLRLVCGKDKLPDGFWTGAPQDSKTDDILACDDAQALAVKWKNEGRLDKLAQLWVRGFSLDWTTFFDAKRCRRVHLPTYPFAKDRYAVEITPSATLSPAVPAEGKHPLLHENVSTLAEFAFLTTLSGREFFLADHFVHGRKLLPAAAFLELAHAAATKMAGAVTPTSIQLTDVVWIRPFYVDANPGILRTTVTPKGPDKLHVEVCTEALGADRVVHCRATALVSDIQPPTALDPSELCKLTNDGRLTRTSCYQAFANAGFRYGPAFQAIDELMFGSEQALAKLTLPSAFSSTLGDYTLHPSLIDASLQVCAILSIELAAKGQHESNPDQPHGLPFALHSIKIFKPCPTAAWAWVRACDVNAAQNGMRRFDVTLCDDEGHVCVELSGFTSRSSNAPMGPPDNQAPSVLSYRPVWQAKPASPDVAVGAGARRIIWNCGMPLTVPAGLICRQLDGPTPNADLGQWFMDAAGRIFQEVRDALATKDSTLIQVLVPANKPESCLSAIAALFRSARQESPRVRGQVIEVGPGCSSQDVADKLALDARCSDDFLIRHTESTRSVPAWIETDSATDLDQFLWKDDGVYIITGGAGGLGRIFAREILAQTKNARVILLGRSALSPSHLESWALPKNRVTYEIVDLSRSEELAAFVQRIKRSQQPVHGFLHAAGITRDNFILKKSLADFRAVLAPKVVGTVNLERTARELKASFLALFSSGTAWFGSPGQTDYATANAFLDSFAELHQDGPTRIMAIDWPLWKDGGMRIEESRMPDLHRVGLVPMPSAQGIAAFRVAMASNQARVMLLAGDTAKLRAFMSPTQARTPQQISLPSPLLDGPDLQAQTIEFVRRIVSQVTKRPPEKLATDVPFEKYGIDSILQIDIIEKLQQVTGELAKTSLFEYPTIGELAIFLLREHSNALRHYLRPGEEKDAERSVSSPGSTPPPQSSGEHPGVISGRENTTTDIAIIGLGGRYPKSDSLEEFWQHLKCGDNCVSKIISTHRWPSEHRAPSTNGSAAGEPEFCGGFLNQIDRFDYALFGIAREQVLTLAPETRLFLEIAWETFQSAGFQRASLHEYQQRTQVGVGVFVGTMYDQYPWTFASSEQAALGSNATEWHIPNRVSHFFDLTGPSLAVNSACSSSLLAIHLACESLLQGNCSMALAGGVNLTLHPSKYRFLQAANVLENRPESKSFGVGQGYVPGEGVGAVLLKPLGQALRDGDNVFGIIKASFASHTGGRQLYTAPDPNQQTRMIVECIRRSGIDPNTIGYVESAANGSPLGDPIEVLALKKAFKEFTSREGYCALGSVKSNFGHLEAASGISQLSKVLLQLRHGMLVPSIHSRPRNPSIRLDGTPFFIQEESRPWLPPVAPGSGETLPRRALINSIGAGGTSVCLLIEEYPPKPDSSMELTALPGYAFDHSHSFAPNGTGYPVLPQSEAKETPPVIFTHDEPFLRDHTIDGKQVLIGVTHASLALDHFFHRFPSGQAVSLQQLTFTKPIEVNPAEQVEVETRSKDLPGPFAVKFRKSGASEWQDTATGHLQASTCVFGRLDIELLKKGCSSVKDLDRIYNAGEPYFKVGPLFRTIRQLFCSDKMALAEIDLAEALQSRPGAFHLHPLVTYSAFSALVPLLGSVGFQHAFLPFGIKQLNFRPSYDLRRAWVVVRLTRSTSELVFFDADVLTQDGAEVALYRDCSIKRLRLQSSFQSLPSLATRSTSEPHPSHTNGAEAVRNYLLQILNLSPNSSDQDSNFMELGLASAKLVELVVRISADTGIALDPTLFFEYPTIRELTHFFAENHAARFQSLQAAPSGVVTSPSAGPALSDHECPLSEGQLGLWAIQQAAPSMTAYNLPLAFRVHGPLDISCFSEACVSLLRKHPLLNSRVELRNGTPVFVCHSSPQFALQQVNAHGWSDAQVLSWLRNSIKTPFNLEKEPPLRAAVLESSSKKRVVLFVIHHLVFDGSSSAILMQSLMDAYEKLRAGHVTESASSLAPHREYVQTERILLDGPEGSRRLAYWKNALSGERSPLEIPTDHPRTVSKRFMGQTVSCRVSSAVVEQLRASVKTHALYPSSVFLTVFNELLCLYSGQKDLVVGMPVNERTDERFQSLVGFFVNMVPIRTRGIGDLPFLESARAVQNAMVSALASRCPFPALVRALNLSGQEAHPVFQAAFEYQNFLRHAQADAIKDVSAGALSVTFLEGLYQEGEYELALEVLEQADGFQVNLKYNPTLLRDQTATRMLAQLLMLLDSATSNPQRALSTELILPSSERQTLLEKWNSTDCSYPTDACIHHFFERQARRTPKAIAITCDDKSLSYAELDVRSRRLALHLQGLGVKPDALVGLCLERSLEMVTAILAVLRAGGAYLPLDPDYPEERLAFMVKDSQTSWILSQSHLEPKVDRIKCQGAHVLFLDKPQRRTSKTSTGRRRLSRDVKSSNLAYVLYTSGSTGVPKGVMVEHRAVCNRILWMQREYRLGTKDRVLQKTPFSFDVSGWEFHWPLLAGARLVLAAPGKHKDPEYLCDVIQDQGITALHFVPSMLQAFLALERAGECRSLKHVFCSGEELTSGHAERFFDRFDKTSLHNLYGPTEAAIDVTYKKCEKHAARITLGKPISNVRLYVTDPQLRLLPIGLVGELCIAGDALARGYLNRPELTADRFVANPFETGSLLYRTGDLARWNSDGEIEFLGRLDQQVKIRGCRIELGEIEAALISVEGIRDAVVLVQPDATANRLVAFYVASSQTASESRLRAELGNRLPDYMIPSVFVQLRQLPLTPSGKLDRRSLLHHAPMPRNATDTHPGNETEVRLAALWSEALGVKSVGTHQSFFDIGGHSLSALNLMTQINSEFGTKLPLGTFFEAKCIAELALRLNASRGRQPHSYVTPLQPHGSRPPFFLIPGIGGNGFGFLPLSRALGADQPVFLFEPPGLQGERDPMSSIPELASFYISQLPSQPPRLGCRLAGWSMGGVVAYEMACQMEKRRMPVDSLILIDSYLPEHFEHFSRMSRQKITPATLGVPPASGPQIGRMAEVTAAHSRALQNYRPSHVYQGHAAYFYARRRDHRSHSPDASYERATLSIWKQYLPRIAKHFSSVRASHTSILEAPAANWIATEIRAFCDALGTNRKS
jgi:polyketide synthase PksN